MLLGLMHVNVFVYAYVLSIADCVLYVCLALSLSWPYDDPFLMASSGDKVKRSFSGDEAYS